jgi:hypothetical protein
MEEAAVNVSSSTPTGQHESNSTDFSSGKDTLCIALDRRVPYRQEAKRFPKEHNGTESYATERKPQETPRELHREHVPPPEAQR